METDELHFVNNDTIEFITARPSNSNFSTLERRVIVTAPPAAVELAGSGDAQALDSLVGLLAKPDRAWAAEVMLAAMTGREAKQVDSFARSPEKWWDDVGMDAEVRWQVWLDKNRKQLKWSDAESMFVLSH